MRKLMLPALLLFAGQVYAQTACTTTLSGGAAVGTAITNAAAGAVICLSDGNYSGFTLNGVTKNPRVTVRANNPRLANFTSTVTFSGGTNGVTLSGVNVRGLVITGTNTREITVQDFNSSSAILITGVLNATPNILLDNFTQTDGSITGCGGDYCLIVEQWPSVRPASPMATIRRAILDGGCADGIRLDAPAIVEYSYIANKVVGSCPNDPHTDAIQFYGGPFNGTIIRNNYFYSNVQVLAAYDSVQGVLVENNVFDPGPSGERRDCQIEFFSDDGSIIQHNTVIDRGGGYGKICFGNKAVDDPGKNTILRNNIAASIDLNAVDGGVPATLAINANNLLASGASGSNIAGSPTFVGTCTGPKSLSGGWSGCQLAASSLGRNAATDGTDVGTAYYGATIIRPNDPGNVVITENWDHLGWFAANWGG